MKRLFSHVEKDLPEVYSPTLLFHSKDDHVIDYKSSEYIYKHISSKNKRILTLQNSYHVLSLDNEKNIIKKETLKFISQIVLLVSINYKMPDLSLSGLHGHKTRHRF